MELLRFYKNLTLSYWGDCRFGILFLIGMVAILVIEKDKLKKIPFFWFSAIALIIIYNPVTYAICKRFFYADSFNGYYLKLYNLMPVIFTLVYGLTLLVSRLNGWARLVAVGLICAVMLVSGTTVQRQPWFAMAENRQHVPAAVLELQEAFSGEIKQAAEDYEQTGIQADRSVHIMVPLDLSVYLRQVESGFGQAYSRIDLDSISAELVSENPNVDMVYEFAIGADMDYIVIASHRSAMDAFDADDRFDYYTEISEYTVYKVSQPRWVVIDCTDASGNQGLCYIIRNTEDNTLVVVDGGSASMTRNVVEDVIQNYGGVVDAWIITHYHSDHVGALIGALKRYNNLEIKAIYQSPLDYEYFKTVAYEWDDLGYFEDYLDTTSGLNNLVDVARGDEITIDKDLHIKFFNTYDELALENGSDDIGNNCALVCKIWTNENSILLMSDCHSEAMAVMMMDEFGDELSANILQCAHHGNNSVPVETGFYELVNPSIAIFDAPQWLMEGEKYSAKDLAEYLEKKGIVIKWYDKSMHAYAF